MNHPQLNVAIVVFNRPTETSRVMETIRQASPRRLFIISDAARPGKESEAEKVQQCRRLCESVSSSCEVIPIYADQNMGCAKRISSGLTEAFEQVDQLLVLEDDCVAHPSFFDFCSSLLARYQDDERIGTISGDNFQAGTRWGNGSYYLSKYFHCWGWATWKRVWEKFELALPTWETWSTQVDQKTLHPLPEERSFWQRTYGQILMGKLDTWAYPFLFHCWQHGYNHILPNVNLVSNIGFGPEATHTKRQNLLANLPVQAAGKMIHPDTMDTCHQADQFSFERIWNRNRKRSFYRWKNWFRSAASMRYWTVKNHSINQCP